MKHIKKITKLSLRFLMVILCIGAFYLAADAVIINS